MPCPRLAAPLLLALALGFAAGPAAARNAEVAATPLPPGEQMPPAASPIPGPGPAAPEQLRPGDAFGTPVVLPERTIIYLQGRSDWDSAQNTLVDYFKSLDEYMDKLGIKPNGPPMTIYTETNDDGFRFRAAVPVAQAPKNAPKGDIAVGKAPSGKALKFVHRGTYEAMDSTYEAITDYLDDKGLDAQDVFVEEYASGPLQAGGGTFVINVYVPVK
jgi:effector-binding domain-containing protein